MSEPRYHYTSTGRRIVAFLLATLFLAGGILLEIYSFKKLREKRQLARLTTVKVNAALPGEVKLHGQADTDPKPTLKAPHSGTKCVYYRFLEEVEKKDSEGKTSWKTVRNETQYSTFTIDDGTGRAKVEPSSAVCFSIPQKYRKRNGKRRFTEWRIDPGDNTTVIGFAAPTADGITIEFSAPGDYVPLITQYSDAEEQSGRGMGSVLMTWGGLTCLSFAVLGFFPVFRQHRLLLFLGSLTIVQMGALGFFGLKLIGEDLSGAVTRSNRHSEQLSKTIESTFSTHQTKWSGEWEDLNEFASYPNLPGAEQVRLTQMRFDLARTQTRIAAQRSAFPEFIVAPLLGISKVTPVPLPPGEQSQLQSQEAAITEARLFTGAMKYVGWGLISVGLLVTIVGTVMGIRRIRIKRCIENIPTSRSKGVAFGLSEVAGTVEPLPDSPPERGPLSFQPCIYYHYIVKEKRGSGKNSKWVTIEDRTHSQLFQCRDQDGAIKVFPYGAEFVTYTKSTRREGRLSYTEYRIQDKDPVYVLGHADIDPFTGNSLMLVEPHEKSFPFIVSNCPESEVVMKKAIGGMTALSFAFSGLMLAILFAFGMTGSFAPTDYLFSSMVGPAFLAFVTVILHYNDIIFLRRRVDRNWSNVDVALKKRHDLIPTIEKVVKGYLAHEQDLQTDLAEMRSQFGQNPAASPEQASAYFQSEAQFTTRFIGLRENYPDLKGNTLVTQMTKTLVEVENEVSLMREGFNDAVQTYNTRIETIPDVFLAKPFGFTSRSHLHFESAIINVPDIQLGAAATATPVASPTGVTNKTFNTGAPSTQTPAPPPTTDSEPERAAAPEPVSAPEPAAPVEPAAPLPYELVTAAKTPESAIALLISLILSETRFTAEDLPKLQEKIGDKSVVAEVQQHHAQVTTVDDRMKLTLVDHCLPALRQLPETFDVFALVKELVEFDTSISLFEYTLLQIFEREDKKRKGDDSPPPVQWYSYASLDPEVSQIASFLANLAHDPGDSDTIFSHCQTLEDKYLQLERLSLDQNSFDKVDEAVNKLAHLDQMYRRKLFKNFTEAVAQIEHPSANQLDFLRAVGERLRAL
jgi:hypothetical protein